MTRDELIHELSNIGINTEVRIVTWINEDEESFYHDVEIGEVAYDNEKGIIYLIEG